MAVDALGKRLRHLLVSVSCGLLVGALAFVLAWRFRGDPVLAGVAALAGSLGSAALFWQVLGALVVRVGIRRMTRSGWLLRYFDETSTQIVHPRHGGWELSGHHAARQAEGIAGPFRQRVFAHLAAEADRLRVVITTSTTVPTLVDIYQADMPGLKLVGVRRTLFGRVYLLRRDPDISPTGSAEEPLP